MSQQTIDQVQVPEKTNKGKRKGGVLILVLLIIVLLLFVLTTIMLGSRLYSMTTRDRYSVDVGVGETDGSIKLFHVTYEGASGQITVEGTNGQQVVAPGTSVDYDVRLRNKDDVIIDYVIVPEVEYFTEDAVPVNFKIMDTHGNYILGDEDTWASAEELNSLTHKGSIHPGEVSTYHVTWQWDFESGNDAYDTYLGNAEGPGLSVSLSTQSSASSVEPKTPSHLMHLLGEGFGCCWCCWLVWILLLIILLMVVWVLRLKRALRKQDKQIEEFEELLEQYNILPNNENNELPQDEAIEQ